MLLNTIYRAFSMIIVWFSGFILLGYSICTLAEELSESPEVYAIEIVGNKVTSTDFILKEMRVRPGMVVTSEMLESDRLHLASLGLFNRVQVKLASDEGRAVVMVIVNEPFYIYLFPIFEYDFEDSDRTVYGFGLVHRNIRGYGERGSVAGWQGYNKGFSLSHSDPWFRIGGRYGFTWFTGYRDSDLRTHGGLYERRYRFQAGAAVRRRLGRRSSIGLGVDWDVNRSSVDYYTFSDGNQDRLIVPRLDYENDMRDYRYYPANGFLVRVIAEGNYLLEKEHVFFREAVDVRGYKSIGKIIVAQRLWIEYSQGVLPYYRRLTLSRSKVRAGTDYGEGGQATAALNLETRFNIIPVRYYSFGGIPFAGPYLLNMPFSVEGVLFIDLGYARYETEGSIVDRDMWAWGCGLQFQLPYIETAHVLIGWRPDQSFNTPSFTSKVGVTF